ncbi:MAG: patatin-like phospholipase family protein [Candidatus Binatus sp.]|uniref:patatin-like phospholipase family protein n=1 Tax=Candidatus Binatus sp. TaxID=2811406 RepID=UPI003C77DAD6
MNGLDSKFEITIEEPKSLVEKLAGLPLLESVEAHLLDAISEEFEWFSLPGGQLLFSQGDTDDSLYVVLSGRLGAFLHGDDGKEILIRQMTAGETVGEMALLSGEPRSATVVALRDTELARLSKAAFTKLIDEHPKALRFVTDLLVRRLRQAPRLAPAAQAARTAAIFPLDRDLAASGFARSFAKAFEELGLKACVIDRSSAARPIEWFNALEEDHDMVLYEADFEPSQWTRHCLRQADRLVMLADATRPLIVMPPALDAVAANPRRAPIELALYCRRSLSPSQTLAFLQRFGVTHQHHVREGVPRDLRRLARMITGRAIGVVLSGGGARGLAHIGVIHALRESGLELDLFGGASMGSIIGAGAAIEWSDEELHGHMREAFFDDNPISDYTVPMISLVRGRKTSAFLRSHFGNRQIEDMPCPYFCVSANLTTGQLKIHRTGPLWLATRASVSIPGVLPPVIDGSDILVDGGTLNNLPIDVMSDMRRGPIVAVDVSSDWAFKATIDDIDQRPLRQLLTHARKGTPNIINILMAAGAMSSHAQVRALRNHVDLLIEPPLAEINMLDWKAFHKTVDAGYRHTMEILEKRKGVLLPA